MFEVEFRDLRLLVPFTRGLLMSMSSSIGPWRTEKAADVAFPVDLRSMAASVAFDIFDEDTA